MTDRCATIIDEVTGAVCGHRLGEHRAHSVQVPPSPELGRGWTKWWTAYPCTAHQRNPDAPEGTDRRLPCPCKNFTPEADPT